MLEIPEAANISRQLAQQFGSKKITGVVAAASPHKFAWYHGNPDEYEAKLKGKTVDTAAARAGMVEMKAGDTQLVFSDGVSLRFHGVDEPRPEKHQLLLEFGDGTAMSASVQMYGGLLCFKGSELENKYYDVAGDKSSPLTDEFDKPYFSRLIGADEVQKLSAKAFLATEQRIPGLGNGVLQDILFNAGIHPKRKIGSLDEAERLTLFDSIKSTLREMASQGGRETEKDLFGVPGGYRVKMGKDSIGKPCPLCGGKVVKEAYMGGSIYYCRGCQKQ